MIKNRNETSAAMDKALKNLEQAKARYEACLLYTSRAVGQ